MLQLRENVSLQPFNTLSVKASARWFAECHDQHEALQAVQAARDLGLSVLPLGGGSNLLLTGDPQTLVLKMCNRGVRILDDQAGQVIIEAEAGEPWHPFVLSCLERGLYGLENLSLIPGTVGAAPIQNIGAYGVELKDRFVGLTAVDLQDGALHEFDRAACAFGYRDSVFKQQPGRWLVLRVRLALSTTADVKLDYGPIRQRLAQEGVATPQPEDVSRVICAVRSEKLPDPCVLPNAGSFFKNPLVPTEQAERLREQFPELVAYPQADGQTKLAAGWLIERAGWKGFRDGDAGVHRLQALVLVNHGQASGAEVLALARRIQADVAKRFGVALEIEPVLV